MNAKQELLDELEKKIRTTFIGAISSFEESQFGQLNGPEWDDEFERLRTEILDKGNAQLRALRKLIENYQVAPARSHRYNIQMTDKPYKKRGGSNE